MHKRKKRHFVRREKVAPLFLNPHPKHFDSLNSLCYNQSYAFAAKGYEKMLSVTDHPGSCATGDETSRQRSQKDVYADSATFAREELVLNHASR
jgi:hypothetical protein